MGCAGTVGRGSSDMTTGDGQLGVGSNEMELVDFRLHEKQADGTVYEGIYGINVSKVREIIVLPSLSRVPDTHPAIEGIFNLRGVQVPAVNLARWLHKEEALPEGMVPKAIVAEFSQQIVGLIVHQATRIRRVSWETIKPPPELVARRHGGSIVGTATIADDLTLLLIDVEKIVAEIAGDDLEETSREGTRETPPAEGAPRVLIADDSAVALKQLGRALRQAGYEVLESKDGRQALERIRDLATRAAEEGGGISDQLQLLVTDAEMPRMDGYSLTVAVKQDEALRGLPVIMHSSLDGEANVRRGREAGCDEYLVKFDADSLLECVGRTLAAHANAD